MCQNKLASFAPAKQKGRTGHAPHILNSPGLHLLQPRDTRDSTLALWFGLWVLLITTHPSHPLDRERNPQICTLYEPPMLPGVALQRKGELFMALPTKLYAMRITNFFFVCVRIRFSIKIEMEKYGNHCTRCTLITCTMHVRFSDKSRHVGSKSCLTFRFAVEYSYPHWSSRERCTRRQFNACMYVPVSNY